MSSSFPSLPIFLLIPIIFIGVCYLVFTSSIHTPLAIEVRDPYYDVTGWLLNLFAFLVISLIGRLCADLFLRHLFE